MVPHGNGGRALANWTGFRMHAPPGRPIWAPLILTALETAVRQGELLAMRWGDVNRERNTTRFPVTKNGHPRIIPADASGPPALA
jgi:integrase